MKKRTHPAAQQLLLPELEWQEGEIQIYLEIGGYQTVPALLCGPLAINESEYWFTLTHVPTGRRITGQVKTDPTALYQVQQSAARLAETLPLTDLRWQVQEGDEQGLKELANLMNTVVALD